MAISTLCPECSRKLRVPDELIGKRVKCPSCGLTFNAQPEEAPQKASSARVSSRKSLPPPPPPEDDFEEVPDDEPQDAFDDLDGDNGRPSKSPKKKKKKRSRSSGNLAPHRGQMIMIMGIVSIPLLFVGFFFIGVILGVVTWILGKNDLKEMEEGRMDPSGESETRTGKMCGMIASIIGMVLGGLGLILFVFWIVVYVCFFGAMFAGAAGSGY